MNSKLKHVHYLQWTWPLPGVKSFNYYLFISQLSLLLPSRRNTQIRRALVCLRRIQTEKNYQSNYQNSLLFLLLLPESTEPTKDYKIPLLYDGRYGEITLLIFNSKADMHSKFPSPNYTSFSGGARRTETVMERKNELGTVAFNVQNDVNRVILDRQSFFSSFFLFSLHQASSNT